MQQVSERATDRKNEKIYAFRRGLWKLVCLIDLPVTVKPNAISLGTLGSPVNKPQIDRAIMVRAHGEINPSGSPSDGRALACLAS